MASIASPISSVSDMMASVPSDLFDGITAPDAPEVDETPIDDTPSEPVDDAIEVPDADEPEPDTADETPAVAEGDKPASEPADKAKTEDELPEGVRKGQDRKGKPGYFLEENRYQTFHGNHKLVQEGSALLGEPLTADALKLRNEAYLGQERMYSNLTSADPALQSDVVKFIVKEMATALENGEVGTDPTLPFAESVYNTLQTEAPAAFEHLQMQSARDLVKQIYSRASQSGDPHLFSSAQRIAAALSGVEPKPAHVSDQEYADYVRETTGANGFDFHTLAEMQGLVRAEDPVAARDRRIADLESRLNTRSQTGTAEQYDTWARKNVADVNTAILNDAVKPSLSSVEEGWKKFPDDYKRLVVDPLHREVIAAVKGDPGFDQIVRDLQARARRATSEQVRAQIGTQITQAFLNRAKQAADAKKAPIVKFAADWLKGRSDQTHERRAGAQPHTTPKGAGAPVNPSLIPKDVGFKDGIFDPSTAVKQMQALLR